MPRRKKTPFEGVINQLKTEPKEIILAKLSCFDSETGEFDVDKLNKVVGENSMKMYEDVTERYQEILGKFPLFYGNGVRSGFNPPKGWLGLVEEISAHIEKINLKLKENGIEPFRCAQVKEKFGGLRIYIENVPEGVPDNIREEVYTLLSEYEKRSLNICEVTGEEGASLCDCNGWIHTLSEKSLKEIGGVRKDSQKKYIL